MIRKVMYLGLFYLGFVMGLNTTLELLDPEFMVETDPYG